MEKILFSCDCTQPHQETSNTEKTFKKILKARKKPRASDVAAPFMFIWLVFACLEKLTVPVTLLMLNLHNLLLLILKINEEHFARTGVFKHLHAELMFRSIIPTQTDTTQMLLL